MKVKDIMTRDLTTVYETASIEELIDLLNKSELSGVPVVNDKGEVVGFISERDVIEAALPDYFEMLRTAFYIPDINQLSRELEEIEKQPVKEHMTTEVVSVTEDEEDLHVADLIIRNGLNQVPVIDEDGMLAGLVRRIDLLEA
ncbi:MAG: HPP family protein, partial [Candidatus Acetothermia bacterium]